MAAARNALGVVALNEGDLRRRRARNSRRRWSRSPTSGWRISTWRCSPRSAATDHGGHAEYQRELELHPTNYKAAFNLGKLYEQRGDTTAQEAAYRKAIEAQPGVRGRLFLSREAAARSAVGGSTKR